MRAKLNKRLEGQGGFTLIELLVVMIIIAILMAVAVPIFLSTKQKATASQAKQNASNVFKAMESCIAGNNNGSLKDSTGTDCSQTDSTDTAGGPVDNWWFANEKAIQTKLTTADTDCFNGLGNADQCVEIIVDAGTPGNAVTNPYDNAVSASYWIVGNSATADAPVSFVVNGDTQEKTCHITAGKGNAGKVKALCPSDKAKW